MKFTTKDRLVNRAVFCFNSEKNNKVTIFKLSL